MTLSITIKEPTLIITVSSAAMKRHSDECCIFCYAECHYAVCRYPECYYAECRYPECYYAECRYAKCRCAKCRYAKCHGYGNTTLVKM